MLCFSLYMYARCAYFSICHKDKCCQSRDHHIFYVAEQVYRSCTQLDKWLDAKAKAKTIALSLQTDYILQDVIRLNHFNAALTGYLAWECITL